MRAILLSFFLVLGFACSATQEKPPQRSHEPSDETFVPYIAEFERVFETSTAVPVVFVPTLDINVIAVCERPAYIIKFSKEVYQKYAGYYGGEGTLLFKKWVFRTIKHEMGHCHYGRPHVNATVLFDHHIKLSTSMLSPDQVGIERIYIAQSIMYPYLIPSQMEDDEEEYYRLELMGISKGYNQLDVKTYPNTESSPKFRGSYPHYEDMGEYIIQDKSGKVILDTLSYLEYLGRMNGFALTEQFQDLGLATGCGED